MFKDLYKKANDSITDEALKNRILNPQPVERKKRSFVPAYSYGSLCAAALALVILLSGKGNKVETPQIVNTEIKQEKAYESHGEAFSAGINDQVKVRTADVPEVANAENDGIAVADEPGVMMMPRGMAVEQGRYEDILYNTAFENKSYALSPFSLENTLSVALNGADGHTEADILSAFNITDAQSQNEKFNSLLSLYKKSKKIDIRSASSVWINRSKTDARFNPDFETTVHRYYSAESHTVKDKNAQISINKWAEDNTNGKIKEIIAGSDFEALIVNAVYFKGSFVNKFDKDLTKEDVFISGGKETKRDFMEQTSTFKYGENGDVKIVRLPYESDGVNISMYVLMGNDRVTNPTSYIENTPLSDTYVNLKMPKFNFEYETSVIPHLENMGIIDITLNKMTTIPLSAFDVIQKTYISTNESGTEAAATTTANLLMTSAKTQEPLYLNINKDFTFVIYDETNNISLFVGEIK